MRSVGVTLTPPRYGGSRLPSPPGLARSEVSGALARRTMRPLSSGQHLIGTTCPLELVIILSAAKQSHPVCSVEWWMPDGKQWANAGTRRSGLMRKSAGEVRTDGIGKRQVRSTLIAPWRCVCFASP